MKPSSPEVSRRMSQVRNKDTAAEMAVRRELHARGYRYRVNLRIPGGGRSRPDIAFTRHRIAVFIDGCFWHRCPEHATFPKSNAKWWADKLEANVIRDGDIDSDLTKAGWAVIRIWEHKATHDAVERIASAVDRSARGTTDP